MRILIFLAVVSTVACRADEGKVPRAVTPSRGDAGFAPRDQRPDRGNAIDPRATLQMAYADIATRIGSHRMTAHSRLVRKLSGTPAKAIAQTIELRVDDSGGYSVSKHIGPHDGSELIWVEGWLYPRVSYGMFRRRRPVDAAEPRRLMDRACGLLPAYLRLLRSFIVLKVAEQGAFGGRPADRIDLRLGPRRSTNTRYAPSGRARRWRRWVVAKRIEGTAWVDRNTHAPLAVKLIAEWSFAPPKHADHDTGIPAEIAAKERGTMRLEFDQRITDIGHVAKVEAPPAEQLVERIGRRRLEVERQMVVGERPLIPKWAEQGDESAGPGAD